MGIFVCSVSCHIPWYITWLQYVLTNYLLVKRHIPPYGIDFKVRWLNGFTLKQKSKSQFCLYNSCRALEIPRWIRYGLALKGAQSTVGLLSKSKCIFIHERQEIQSKLDLKVYVEESLIVVLSTHFRIVINPLCYSSH